MTNVSRVIFTLGIILLGLYNIFDSDYLLALSAALTVGACVVLHFEH